jgi:hypothetical protein
MKFRTPEIFLGAFLAVAIFAMGVLFASSQRPSSAPHQSEQSKAPDSDLTGSTWLTKDAAGFFTFVLVCVGGVQAWFFWVQLRLIRESLADTKKAADAAGEAAESTRIQAIVARDTLTNVQRPYLFIFNISPLALDGQSPVGNPRVFVTYTVASYGLPRPLS